MEPLDDGVATLANSGLASGSLSIFRRCRNFESEIAEEHRWRAGGGGKREQVMAYKDILVYLDPTDEAQSRLSLAVTMAQAHGARLTGVDASSEAALGGAWGELASRIGPEFEAAIKKAELVGRAGRVLRAFEVHAADPAAVLLQAFDQVAGNESAGSANQGSFHDDIL